MTSTTVSLVKVKSYDHVESAIRQALSLLGGIEKFLQPGWKVLLKPNLLFGMPAEKCVNTHPEMVKAVVKIVIEAGCYPMLGDSPAVGKGSLHYGIAGYRAICREMEVPWIDFEDNAVEVMGKSAFKRLEIAQAVLQADAIINLPKVKTHGQTYLTLAVKNMFGIVPGVRKSRWHMVAGADAVRFSRMLVEICYFKKPVLNIADGIMAMEGNGPRSGNPFRLGYIIAGEDASAVDRIICQILGAKFKQVPTLIADEGLGMGITNIQDIEIVGAELTEAKNFHFGGQQLPSSMGKIGFLVPLVKNSVNSRPAINRQKCNQCENCINVCPAGVMNLGKKESVEIDLDQCIRCYCCSEICPEGAISVKQGSLWKWLPGWMK